MEVSFLRILAETACSITKWQVRKTAASYGTPPRPASEIFADFQMPQFSTPEIKLPVDEESKFALMEKIVGLADFPDGLCNYLDGLRVEFEKGWGLIRASNTSPALLMRFEAEDAATMNDIKDRFKALIHSADKSIGLNF